MRRSSIIVRAEWDAEASVWVASSPDIAGLSLEADTLERLKDKVFGGIQDLMDLNGFESDLAEIPVHFVAEQFARVSVPLR